MVDTPRYLRQYNNFSCGPIAILNALKWAGRRVTYAYHYEQLAVDCGLKADEDDYGTDNRDLDRVLRMHGKDYYTVRKPKTPTFEEFEQHLKNGGSAILCYLHYDEEGPEGHYAFFPEYLEESDIFVGINDKMYETYTERTRTELLNRFKKREHGKSTYPRVWLLTRCEDKSE